VKVGGGEEGEKTLKMTDTGKDNIKIQSPRGWKKINGVGLEGPSRGGRRTREGNKNS